VSAKTAAKGHTVKHTKTSKAKKKTAKHAPAHHKTAVTHKATGHKVTTKGTHATHAKAVGFAVGDLLPVCGFEAVAQSLRLAGQFVHDDEVAWLWELTGADPLGASVAAALDTASLHGLAGLRPRFERLAGVGIHAADHLALPFAQDEAVSVGPFEDFLAGDLHLNLQLSGLKVGTRASRSNTAFILHVDVPGPHAVLATADGWWSWGELYSPWAATVEAAWAVSWS
jgi:hypothetical protein